MLSFIIYYYLQREVVACLPWLIAPRMCKSGENFSKDFHMRLQITMVEKGGFLSGPRKLGARRSLAILLPLSKDNG